MDFFEIIVGDVGVDLGGGNAGVSEEALDSADVGTVHEDVCGERMAHGVR